MAKLPAQSSYFSISAFLSSDMTMQTAIALDIVREYFRQQASLGNNVRNLSIEGYGEYLTFDEACLGSWMVFDKLYGKNAPYPSVQTHGCCVGWNGDVHNPAVDIPMALKLFEDLNAPASSYNDKFSRMTTIKKWFYRMSDSKFVGYSSYDVLKDINPKFYNWILNKLQQIDETINIQESSRTVYKKKYIFDVKPYAKFYDSEYSPNPSEIGIMNINEAIIIANKFYMSFLTIFEQVLYQFTKQIFPLKLYATISYLFNAYLTIIMDFLKPYHSELLKLSPNFQLGNNLSESIVIGESFTKIIVKRLFDDIFHRTFDDSQETYAPYDVVSTKIKDFIKLYLTKLVKTKFQYNMRFDMIPFLFDTQHYGIEENVNIYKFSVNTDSKYFAGSSADWCLWAYDLEQNKNKLNWNILKKTVTNNWNRSVIILPKNNIKQYISKKTIDEIVVSTQLKSIFVDCSDDCLFALSFKTNVLPEDVIQRVPLKIKRFGEWWSYKNNTWQLIDLPYPTSIDLGIRGPKINELFGTYQLMSKDELLSITNFPNDIKYLIPAIFIPNNGGWFKSIKFVLSNEIISYE